MTSLEQKIEMEDTVTNMAQRTHWIYRSTFGSTWRFRAKVADITKLNLSIQRKNITFFST
jgi:hypothetical protein